MPKSREFALVAWRSIPSYVRGLAERLTKANLDRRREGAPMSIRETVHHIAEAEVVAASIVIAALGSPGCVYDWSWMMPFGPWNDRLDYTRKPIGPALALIEALNGYVAAQVEPLADGLARTVRLRDQRGGKLRTTTVAQVLLDEADHAREHVDEARIVLTRPRETGRGRKPVRTERRKPA